MVTADVARATELAVKKDAEQKVRRAVETAAERLSADPLSLQAKLDEFVPDADETEEQRERRLATEARVRALEAKGYQVLLAPPQYGWGPGGSVAVDPEMERLAGPQLETLLLNAGLPASRAKAVCRRLLSQSIDSESLLEAPGDEVAAVLSAPEVGMSMGERLKVLRHLKRAQLPEPEQGA